MGEAIPGIHPSKYRFVFYDSSIYLSLIKERFRRARDRHNWPARCGEVWERGEAITGVAGGAHLGKYPFFSMITIFI